MGEFELGRLRVKIEPVGRYCIVIRVEVVELLARECLKLVLVRLNVDVVETDCLNSLSIDIGSKILDIADSPRVNDLCRRVVENYPLTG